VFRLINICLVLGGGEKLVFCYDKGVAVEEV